MKHFTYRTETPSGRYYLGRHSTDNLEDGYQGSGVWVAGIKNKETLTTTIQEYYADAESLLEAEEKLIALHFDDPLNMNKTLAANGFVSGDQHPNKTPEMKAKLSAIALERNIEYTDDLRWRLGAGTRGKPKSEEQKRKMSEAHKGQPCGCLVDKKCAKHSDAANKKRSLALMGKKKIRTVIPTPCDLCGKMVEGKGNMHQHRGSKKCDQRAE